MENLKHPDYFALIIGAMKCGTTSIFHSLAEHPEIAPCKQKEPNFFASEENWLKGLDWYRSLWEFDPDRHTVAMEGSTHYTRIPGNLNAAQKIAQVDARFKFIYVIRNPIDRIESHYTHGLRAQWGSKLKPIEEGIDSRVIEASKYAKQIDEYYKRFPAQNILLVDFEDLKYNFHHLLRKICEFLCINSLFEFSDNIRQARNPSLGRTIEPPIFSSKNPIMKLIPKRSKKYIYSSFCKKVESKVKLSDKQKDYILIELRDDLKRLEVNYGFNISQWDLEI